jgi:alkyl hydroperoxide reductase subunit AhpC
MIELGQLEEKHAEFEKRNARVVVVSLEDQETAQLTQNQFPHLLVIADADRGLADAVQVIHPESSIDGGDTTAPTTMIIGGDGQVRWVFRATRYWTRLTPDDLLAQLDEHWPVP